MRLLALRHLSVAVVGMTLLLYATEVASARELIVVGLNKHHVNERSNTDSFEFEPWLKSDLPSIGVSVHLVEQERPPEEPGDPMLIGPESDRPGSNRDSMLLGDEFLIGSLDSDDPWEPGTPTVVGTTANQPEPMSLDFIFEDGASSPGLIGATGNIPSPGVLPILGGLALLSRRRRRASQAR